MNKKLREKFLESFKAVIPITVIVFILSVILVPMEVGTFTMFILGALLLIVGMGFFQLGAEMAMTPMGEGIGGQISKSKKVFWMLIICVIMGVIITVAEPDLQVLANQVQSISNQVLIWSVATGVGIFLAMAVLRIFFKLSLSYILIISYALIFILSFFTPSDFTPVAFDSGGVTTGPITVPFILAMGIGLARTRSDKDASSDSFGLVALCSLGPIISVLILGIFNDPTGKSYISVEIPSVLTMQDVVKEFAVSLPYYLKDVALSIGPVIAVFLAFQILTKRFKHRQLIRMIVGFVYTFMGLALFLTGVDVGFSAVGNIFGTELVSTSYNWILVPIGMLIGYFIVKAEPAVQVLNRNIEEITNGAIPHSAMNRSLSIGVAVSVGLSMVRILTGISIYWIIIPGYLISLIMTFFVPKIFVGIAFDSGGVASGPMATTFLLPLAMGASEGIGGNILTDAFGVVAMVAMTPLIAVQAMGLIFAVKMKRAQSEEQVEALKIEDDSDDIIVLEEVLSDE
ncbi:MAG: DUF1538 domain-containing protein [Oscillospiraceae bacterium]|nr:DUF1538 domain-containing protein [Oscillospiraceae bacterium]